MGEDFKLASCQKENVGYLVFNDCNGVCLIKTTKAKNCFILKVIASHDVHLKTFGMTIDPFFAWFSNSNFFLIHIRKNQ